MVELWAFLGRFSELIGLERVPSIAELEADLAAPSAPRSITTSALVDHQDSNSKFGHRIARIQDKAIWLLLDHSVGWCTLSARIFWHRFACNVHSKGCTRSDGVPKACTSKVEDCSRSTPMDPVKQTCKPQRTLPCVLV